MEILSPIDAQASTGNIPKTVVHGATASTARPANTGQVFWIGTVQPTNMAANDIWFDPNAPSVPAGTYPGQELGYAERTTNDTTTNTVAGDAASNLIPGLSVTVTGIGRPVEVEFHCYVIHSVVDGFVGAWPAMNGALVPGGFSHTPSISTSRSPSLTATIRPVLTDGVNYTFEVGKFISDAGTGTFGATTGNPMWLAVTQR